MKLVIRIVIGNWWW